MAPNSSSGALVLFLVCAVLVFSGTADDCPLFCECNYQLMTVSCYFNIYVTEFPVIPSGTIKTKMQSGKFGELSGLDDTICQRYQNLTILELRNSEITAVKEGAFKCMQNLEELTLDSSGITTIAKDAFESLSHLKKLSITQTNISEQIIPSICAATNLTFLNFYHRVIIKPHTLDCVGRLDHLSSLDLTGNYVVGSLKDIINPVRNLTEYLSLRDCNITSLQNDTFNGLLVKELDLSNNKLGHIPMLAFSQMPNLKTLILRSTRITETSEWLLRLPQIQDIQLGSNKLEQMPPLNQLLQSVSLGNCHIGKLIKGSFSNLVHLKQVQMSNCRISEIERSAFANLPQLEVVKLNMNGITGPSLDNLMADLAQTPVRSLFLKLNPLQRLTNKTFELFHPNALERLYLSGCDIDEIQPGAFKNFTYVFWLDLSRNKLFELRQGAFEGLKSVSLLQLSDNNLQELGPDTFDSLESLETLQITGNRLVRIESEVIGLTACPLKFLYLSGNKISAVRLHNMPTLIEIDVSYNTLSDIATVDYQDLPSLQVIAMGSNIFRDLTSGALTHLPNLTKLDLSGNDGGMWDDLPDFLGNMSSLKDLNLHGSELGQLGFEQQKKIWANLPSLSNLRISDSLISTLFPGMFESLPNLDKLDVSSNLIAKVEPRAFQGVSNLSELNLKRNLINYVNWESFLHIPNLKVLYMSQNPLLCTCEILWTIQAMANPFQFVFIREQDRLVCKNPPELENVKLMEIKLSVADCEQLLIAEAIGIVLAGIAIIIILSMVWHYRWHVRYTFFLARAGRGRYKELHDNKNYTFDAFVAYSSADLWWVEHQLLPNIDSDYLGDKGFKLCIHDRDWLVGVDITENIVKSIAESRRTILVLTKNFAESQWCQFELAMAHLRLNSEGYKQDRLLVILLDKIPDDLLTPRLIYMLSKKTYLAWPMEEDKQKLFWKTLHKSMRKELLYKAEEDEV